MRVGDKVICVDDTFKMKNLAEVLNYYPNWVKKGLKYTIREIFYNDDIVTGIVLEELINHKIRIDLINAIQEPAFGTFRFRLLQPDEAEEMDNSELVTIEQEIFQNGYN